MTVWVAMPAYNEAPRLPGLLDRWGKVLAALNHPHRLVLVDDGSTDETPAILRRYAASLPLEIITHTPNRGLGASLRDALRYVAEHGAEDDVLAMMDADGTQPPELLPQMLHCLESTGGDVVIASRFRPGSATVGLSRFRRFMTFGARVFFRLVFPIPGVRDYTCGYRLYRVAVIRRAFTQLGQRFCARPGFDCTADILLHLSRIGATFAEIPMTLRYDQKQTPSTMPVPRTVLSTLRLILRHRMTRW